MSSGLIFIRNSGRKSQLLCVLATVSLLVFVNSVHAETWTLWAKTQLFGFDSGGKKTWIDWFSNPAAETKESSSFSNQANCETQRKSILQKFRDVQGKIEMPDDNRTVTIKVDGEIISMITEFHDGKGNSHQNIELLCRNDV
jgi:hypothetical protein